MSSRTAFVVFVVVLVSSARALPGDSRRLFDFSSTGPCEIPKAYPLYKQCDGRWGKDLIHTKTVCAVGCLMSSISMAIAGHNITISEEAANPGTLNAWLKTHGGYTDDNDLIESVVPHIDQRDIQWKGAILSRSTLSPSDIRSRLQNPNNIIIANVMHGRHFVLVTGVQGDDVVCVNDPGFARDTYSYDDIVGYRLFTME